MSHCLCGVCKECRERAKQIVELMKKAEEFGKKHNCSPLVYFYMKKVYELRKRKGF